MKDFSSSSTTDIKTIDSRSDLNPPATSTVLVKGEGQAGGRVANKDCNLPWSIPTVTVGSLLTRQLGSFWLIGDIRNSGPLEHIYLPKVKKKKLGPTQRRS